MSFILKIPYVLLIFLLSSKYELIWGQNRIIGGKDISIQKVPYMLHLDIPVYDNFWTSCGASIIGKEWGLTAAHCFDKVKKGGKLSVIAGNDDLKNKATTAKTYRVTKYIIHEHYIKLPLIKNDIAVFKVSPPFTFNSVVKPVKLPEKGKQFNKNWATVTGWGYTSPGGKAPSKLRYVTVPHVPIETCKKIYGRGKVTLRKGQICYGFSNKTITQDKCQGDSGGPLVNSQSIEIGIVSYGIKCGTEGFPGVYTDTLYFRDWIKQKTGI